MACRADPENPEASSHLKNLYLITPPKTFFFFFLPQMSLYLPILGIRTKTLGTIFQHSALFFLIVHFLTSHHIIYSFIVYFLHHTCHVPNISR